MGGAGGTLVAPGVGTIGGAIGGAELGGAAGATAGSAAGNATGNALCPDNNEPKCKFEREVYYGGPTKTCVYKQRGAFGLITFPQWKDKSCPPIDPDTCIVDTRGLPGYK